MKAVLYGRFSPRPDSATSESIETQFERCRAFCTIRGWEVDAEYSDKDASGGSTDGRPGLESAISHACRLRGVLVAYSLCRLSRDTVDTLMIADRLRSCRADFALVSENLGNGNPDERLQLTIIASVKEHIRRKQNQLTSDSMKAHQARGRRMGRKDRLPYGKMLDPKDKKRIVDCPEEFKVIQMIRSLSAHGMGPRAIGRQLDFQIIPCRGRPWHHSTISSILKAHAQLLSSAESP